jgi:hypothetical protein
MPRLFDRKYVYPSDGIGEYVTLEGPVVAFKVFEDRELLKVTVRTKHGDMTGWAEGRMADATDIGNVKQATIRVYNAGGGFYPDNRITGLSWLDRP